MQQDRAAALIATSIAGTALMISTFQAYVSWTSLQQYRESFLFSKRAEVCVNTLRDVSNLADQLSLASGIAIRETSNSERYSRVMNRIGPLQQNLNGHMSFVILGTAELARDAETLEKSLNDAVTVAMTDGATSPQIDEALAHTQGPRTQFQNACMALARGSQ